MAVFNWSAIFFHEDLIIVFSAVILSLLLIQGGQLSVSGKRMCTIHVLVNHLEDYTCPAKVGLGKLTLLDMTPMGWLDSKTSTQTNQHYCCHNNIFNVKYSEIKGNIVFKVPSKLVANNNLFFRENKVSHFFWMFRGAYNSHEISGLIFSGNLLHMIGILSFNRRLVQDVTKHL